MKRLAPALALLALVASVAAGRVPAQERGAAALGELVAGLGVSARVLVIGAHPDDEDTRLITFLARGRHVETAYLSLTRGDGGQNLIGNELGEALGVIRTEELLAARRIDGASQYFTRAYDFGFSKTADETFRHWPRDTVLGDVVRVVRAFRPHVIVAIFSGTPRDGHGHHQASGILAREAYDVAGDTARFPARAFGGAWTVSKFYRNATYRNHEGATARYNAGEYSPLLGRSYGEIAALSRSQHKSQAFGMLQPKGPVIVSVQREASRVNESTPGEREGGLFGAVDTTLARLSPGLGCRRPKALLDSVMRAIRDVRRSYDPFNPDALVGPLSRTDALLTRLLCVPGRQCAIPIFEVECAGEHPDVLPSLLRTREQVRAALILASGVVVEAEAERPVVALGDSVPVRVTVYNRGRRPVNVSLGDEDVVTTNNATLLPDSVVRWRDVFHATREVGQRGEYMQPWWLARPRRGDLFSEPASSLDEESQTRPPQVPVTASVSGGRSSDIVFRYADPIRGEIQRPLAVAPAVSVTLDRTTELAQAGAPLDRTLHVTLRSAATSSRDVKVTLTLPAGLSADSGSRSVTLPQYGAVRSVDFRLIGRLPAGRHAVRAVALSRGETFATGYVALEYEHIRPQRMYRDAVVQIEAVDVKLPPRLTVAYVPGVGDNSAPTLEQLGIPLTVIQPSQVATTDFSRFRVVIVGPRAYESSPELAVANNRLLDYVRNGGTMIVQYGQYEMLTPGIMPYPITLTRPADRVTDEAAPVRVLDPASPLLTTPNRITDADFAGWVQDRSLYMPRTFDERYAAPLETNDPGEPANRAAILASPYGKGTYVYTTLAFFRQLPAGVPGAVRVFANLLGAAQSSAAANGARVVP